MASGAAEYEDEGITGINVTPLVDITLVLLIIFMVTASYIVKETIEVELPRAAHGGETVQKTFAVLVTRDGKTFLNGDPWSLDDLAKELKSRNAKKPIDMVILRADHAVPYEKVVLVMDIVKQAGIENVALPTKVQKIAQK